MTIRTRLLLLPVVAVGALALSAVPSSATSASITLDTDIALTSDRVTATGTCAAPSTTAVVSVSQGSTALDQQAVDVVDGSFEATLSLVDGKLGTATVTVECLAYGSADPVATARADLLVVPDDFAGLEEIPVSVSPAKVAIGSTMHVTAQCAPGTTTATVQVGNTDADLPFLDRVVVPSAAGTVEVNAVVKAADGVTPRAGDAVALVVCGDLEDADSLPGIGFAEFTLTTKPASAVPVVTAPATDKDQDAELAMTGSRISGLLAAALSLLVAGGAGIAISRRVNP